MLIDNYHQEVINILQKVYKTQFAEINKAAALVYNAIRLNHNVYLTSISHGIEGDLVSRAGGLNIYQFYRSMEDIKNGDVIIISSVSGLHNHDIAWSALLKGAQVILLTSSEFSTYLNATDEKGRKLSSLATVVIDNCAPVGDALIDATGVEQKAVAASGFTSLYILWAITIQAIDKLRLAGHPVPVFRSINLPDGQEYNHTLFRKPNRKERIKRDKQRSDT